MSVGSLSFVVLSADNEDYQPASDIIYRVLWINQGGQTNQTIRIKDTDDSGIENHTYKKDNSYASYNAFYLGQDVADIGGTYGMGLYISNQYYLNLSGASASDKEVIICLLEVQN